LDLSKEGKSLKVKRTASKDETDVFMQPGEFRRRIQEIVARFRERGATSPEKAMSVQELGLPPRFEEAMKRRLGATGIFVEVGGKYYLDEARLQQAEQWLGTGAGGAMGEQWASRRNMLDLRIARMVVGIAVLALVVSNVLFVQSAYLRLAVVVLFVVWIALTVVQLYYVSRMRRALGGDR